MFIGRKPELGILEKFYNRSGLDIIAVYGRRRVGKTELLKTFIKGKKSLFYAAEETTPLLNLTKISELYGLLIEKSIGRLDSWEILFEYLKKESSDERLIIVMDEFPYLHTHSNGFLSKFQHIIDHQLKGANILLVLCGSSITFMEDEVFSHKSPLFGRLSGQLLVKPFDYYDASKMFPGYTKHQKMEAYFVLGGMPQYLQRFDNQKSLEQNIIDKLLDTSEELFNAPANVIKQELRAPAVYNAILEAVSEGASKSNEINTKIGVSTSIGQNYINTLVSLHLIDKLRPTGIKSKRKTIYRISDNLFDFVYRFCYRYRSTLEIGLGENVYKQFIQSEIPGYFGKKFEVACIQYLNRLNSKLRLPVILTSIGTWWGGNPITKKSEEIDIIGLGVDFGLYGECKYRNNPVNKEVLDELIRKSLLVSRKTMIYYLFSKSGFTKSLKEYCAGKPNIHLISIGDMFDLRLEN
ncbi:MAG: ATP-binding protein [Clostridiales bacterium]|nr:ATP-binding protein [Clostridiales bacterium]